MLLTGTPTREQSPYCVTTVQGPGNKAGRSRHNHFPMLCTITLSYLKLHPSTVVHPTNHDVGARHLTVGREPEAHPASSLHTDCKRDGLLGEVVVPVQLVLAVAVQGSRKSVGCRQVMSAQGGVRMHYQNEN